MIIIGVFRAAAIRFGPGVYGCLLWVIVLAGAPDAWAWDVGQTAQLPVPAAAPPPQTSSPPVTYAVGPGDLLSIAVFGMKEFDQSVRVSNSGKIHVPYLGVLKVADLTVSGIESEIARLLRERSLVKEPWVQVRIEQYRAQPVYILGEVMGPGQFVITSEMYLSDLITLAAGFNEVASSVGFLYRRKVAVASSGQPEAESSDAPAESPSMVDEVLPIDFRALASGKQPELNLKLRGGDVLYVPQQRKQRIFVVGDVTTPGVYETVAGQEMRLTQAVSKAGGPLRTAKTSKGVLVRFDRSGGRQEFPVDFKAILMGRKPDPVLQENDIIFIPGSTAKTLGYGLLGIIPGVVTNTAVSRE